MRSEDNLWDSLLSFYYKSLRWNSGGQALQQVSTPRPAHPQSFSWSHCFTLA